MSDSLTAEQAEQQYAEQQYPGKSDFVSLHSHSIFSMLDGVGTPNDYFKTCAERKSPAFALTEHGVLSSIPDAYIAAKEHKVKQITGCELYYNDFELIRKDLTEQKIKWTEWRKSKNKLDKTKEELENEEMASRLGRNRHLTVLCKNMTGYYNLLKINKYAHEFGKYIKPRVWFEKLAEHKEGLIILSGCLNGPVAHEIRNENIDSKTLNGYKIIGAIDYIKKFKEVFKEDYYIELQMPCINDAGFNDVKCFNKLVELAHEFKLKTVLCNDVHYLSRADFQIQRVMMAIDQGLTVTDPELFHVNSDEQYFKTRYELRYTFNTKGYSENNSADVFENSCDNTLEVADKCETFKPDLKPKLPHIDNADEKLIRLAYKGLKSKGLDKDIKKYLVDNREVTYFEQMEIELKRFIEKGFSSYFLITRDLVKCSTDKGMPIGPARGCVTSESKILTTDGFRSIIDIEVCDKVYDGFYNIQTVEKKLVYDVDEYLAEITLENGKVLRLTSDHKLYVIRNFIVICKKVSDILLSDRIVCAFGDEFIIDHESYRQHNSQFVNEIILSNCYILNNLKGYSISSINMVKYVGKVYDLTISSTHCYNLDGVFSSNSAGGSLVCYLLDIHSINPLLWGLSYNRFMSPARGGYMLKIAI